MPHGDVFNTLHGGLATSLPNRTEAGRRLARRLTHYANQSDVVVLGLPRGGVVVAYAVARAVNAPLDFFLVRKLGAPFNEEFAIGAIASGGVRVLDGETIARLNISEAMVDAITARERLELERREHVYRVHDRPAAVAGRMVILVDDGVATGATMRAAVEALRQLNPAKIIVAAPVMAASAFAEFKAAADEVVALLTPGEFRSVGEWYQDFRQVTDDEVCALLNCRSPATAGEAPNRPD